MRPRNICLLVTVICHSFSFSLSATLAPPHSPVKVLAAAGVSDPADRMRYYSFSEEDERLKSSGSTNPYSSKDPFEVPSLSAIAEMMRQRDKDRNGNGERQGFRDRDGPEHRSQQDTGWGWKNNDNNVRPRPPPSTSAPSGWGWSTTPPRPPPSSRESWGWDKERLEHSRPQYGKGSYAPVDSRDAYSDRDRPWQTDSGSGGGRGDDRGPGWGQVHTTTERPRYTPNYLASDEEKYRPIRYPPSVTGGRGTVSGWSSNPVQEKVPQGWPPQKEESSGGWSSNRERERPVPEEPVSGPGSHYLPPRREPPPLPPRDPPLRDPPKWPANERDRGIDSSRDRDRDGWKSPPPSSSNWDSPPARPNQWESNSRPRPQPQPAWPSREEPKSVWGWSEPTRPPPPPPPPPTPSSSGGGWGWNNNNNRESQREEPPRRPSPFEYKPGVHDLRQNIPSDVYERSDYPPGISRDRPVSKFESSFEDDTIPRAPNHYRIVAYTPSPEEIHKILYQKPYPGGSNDDDYPHKDESGKCGRKCGSKNNGEQDKEQWYTENFKKQKGNIENKTPSSHSPSEHPNKKPATSLSSNGSKGSQIETLPLPALPLDDDDDGKGSSKHTRYDASGFKYIPHDYPATKSVTPTPPRDIYSNLDFRDSRDSFKRAVQGKFQAKEKAREQSRLQGSASSNSYVRRSLSRSHISLWNSEDNPTTTTSAPIETKSKVQAKPRGAASFRSLTTSTTTTTSKPIAVKKEREKEEAVQDYGRKIQIIRNRIKNKDGGFKPVSGPFGSRSAKAREREPLFEGPKSEINYSNSTIIILDQPTLESSTEPSVIVGNIEENEK